jgi:hypothetical protein
MGVRDKDASLGVYVDDLVITDADDSGIACFKSKM